MGGQRRRPTSTARSAHSRLSASSPSPQVSCPAICDAFIVSKFGVSQARALAFEQFLLRLFRERIAGSLLRFGYYRTVFGSVRQLVSMPFVFLLLPSLCFVAIEA